MSSFLSFQSLKNILFFDIETVSLKESFQKLSTADKKNWTKKARQFTRNTSLTKKELSQLFHDKAGIFAEFSKVICISVGFFIIEKKEIKELRVRSYYSDDEKEVLEAFQLLLNDYFNQPKSNFLCGHNLREFDIPFLCRRLLVNHMELPKLLKLSGKRPWQIQHVLDTLDLWRFGDFKHYISLDLLASIFNIPSPKDDIDGTQVHDVYWKDKDMIRIAKYCEKDVATVASLILHLNGMHDFVNFKAVSTSTF